jgi:hypothetical protein
MARLGVTWYDDLGMPHDIAMGSYQPTGTDTHYNLAAEGVPDGSPVCSFPVINGITQTYFIESV